MSDRSFVASITRQLRGTMRSFAHSRLPLQTLGKIARFAGTGVISGLIYAAVTALSISFVGLTATAGSVVGYAAAIPVNFALQRSFTFRSEGQLSADFIRYSFVQGTNMALCWAAMVATVDILHLHYAFGIVAAILIVPLVTYFVMDRWVFRQQSHSDIPASRTNGIPRSDTMNLTSLLGAPQLYQAYQELGGFFRARLIGLERHLPMRPGDRIIDIGCGPGYIAHHLRDDIQYIGFDVDQRYIDFANRHFGNQRTRFFCRFFDNAAADKFGPADIVMMNGVLHHISDADVGPTLGSIARALKPGGRLFTLDGVFLDDQSPFARYLLNRDRGQYVRRQEGYRELLRPHFASVEDWVYNDISRLPYSFFISVCQKSHDVAGEEGSQNATTKGPTITA